MSDSDTFGMFLQLFFGASISLIGGFVLKDLGVAPTYQNMVIVFGALIGAFGVYGYTKAPKKSHEQVEKSQSEKNLAERKARKAQKKAEEARQEKQEALEEAEAKLEKAKQLQQEARNRQDSLDEEVSQKAEEMAKDLAEEKAQELFEDWKQEERKNLAQEHDFANLAYVGGVEAEAKKEVEQMRSKLKDFLNQVIEDEDLIQIIEDRGLEELTEEQLEVFIETDKNPNMKKELEQIREVDGSIDLWVSQKVEELEEKDTEEDETERVEETDTEPEEATPEDEGLDPAEIFGDVEPDEEELTEKERFFKQLEEEEFNTTQNDIIRCAEKGLTKGRAIADKLNLNPDTIRRNYKPLREEKLIETGRKGFSLTDRGREYAEYLTG